MAVKLGSAVIYIGGNSDELKRSLDGAGGMLRGFTSKAGGWLKAGFAGMVGGISASVTQAAMQIPAKIGAAIKEAAASEAMTQTFTRLVEQAGSDYENAIGQLREATRGMVADTDLMQGANKFLSMGLANSTEEAARLAEMATQLGTAMGEDAAGSMENFALMLANQSIERLDSFAISSGKARERVNELMAADASLTREQAFMTAVLEQGALAMEKVGEQGNNAAAQQARLRATMENLKITLGRQFLPIANELMGGVAAFATRMAPKVEAFLGRIGPWLEGARGRIQGLLALGRGAANGILGKLGITTGGIRLATQFGKGALGTIGDGLKSALQAARSGDMQGALSALLDMGGFIGGLRNRLAQAVPGLLRWLVDQLRVWFPGLGPMIDTVITPLLDTMQPILDMVWSIKDQVVTAVSGLMGQIGESGLLGNLWGSVQRLLGQIAAVVQQVVGDVLPFIEPLLSDAVAFVSETIGGLVAWFTENLPLIEATISTVLDAILAVWEWVWPYLQDVLLWAWESIKAAVSAAVAVIEDVIMAVMLAIQGDWEGAWDAVLAALTEIWELIEGVLRGAIDTVLGWFGTDWESLKDAIAAPFIKARDIIKGVFDKIEGWWNTIQGWFKKIKSLAADASNTVVGSGGAAASSGQPGADIEAASGFTGIVRGATRILAGEGGQPEFVHIAPLNRMGLAGAGAGPVNITLNMTVNGGDPLAMQRQAQAGVLQALRMRGVR